MFNAEGNFMKVLFDLAASQTGNRTKLNKTGFTGGGEYCKVVFTALIIQKSHLDVEVFFDVKREKDSKLVEFCKENNVNIYDIDINNELNELINVHHYDVVYSALPGNEYKKVYFPAETKFVFTQHGLRGLELLKDKYELNYTKEIKNIVRCVVKNIIPETIMNKRIDSIRELFDVTSNKRMITDSYHSKNSLLWFFPDIQEEQICVAAAPAKICSLREDEDAVLDNYGISSKKFFLLVCADRWEKNNYRMIIALKNLIKKRRKLFEGYKILVLGNDNGTIYNRLITSDIKDFFIFKGYVSTEELEVFYKNAYTFLYPSLNEGFGYPPIEAMKYGTLSVCAADSSITEVCGDAVLYFNPYNINEMSIRVLQSFDKNVRGQIEERMYSQYERVLEIQKKGMDIVLDTISQQYENK